MESKLPSQFDTQVSGDHYISNTIQPLQYIIANNIPFCEGNIIKYITRYQSKNGAEDIKKVIHYAMFLLETKYEINSKIVYDK